MDRRSPSTFEELLELEPEELVRAAAERADEVISIWHRAQGCPPLDLDAPSRALSIVRNWLRTGVTSSEIKSLAANAYSVVASSNLPHGSPERAAGRAAAHTAFALHFLSLDMPEKVLAAARDAISSAELASEATRRTTPSP